VTKKDFAEYDEQKDFLGEWPYGDECLVHAVGVSGENFLVYVKAQPHRHTDHSCDHHDGKRCECSCNDKEEGACKQKQCKHSDCAGSKKSSHDLA
jgi:hypothetical protein